MSARWTVVLGWALGVAGFAYLLALPPTLHKADESYLLYGAKRIVQGQALYRDFFDFLTPGGFYLYALAYAVGGTSITTARLVTASLNALAVTCTYFLALRVASAAEALLAGALVVTICVPVWNMASHHWMATSLGLAAAATLLGHRQPALTRVRAAAAGALVGLVVCTDQGRGLWLMLWLAITVPALAFASDGSDRWRTCRRQVAWSALGGAAVCGAILGYAVARASLAEMREATYTWVLGNYAAHHVGRMRWAGYSWLWANGLPFTWEWLLEAVPAVLALEVAATLWRISREGLRHQVARAAVLLLAVLMAASIVYFPDYIHVAFILPYSLVVLAGMAYRMRTSSMLARSRVATGGFRFAWVVLLLVVIAKAWSNAALAWSQNPVLSATAFGTIASGEPDALALRGVRERLGDVPRPWRLFSYPVDVWFYLVLPADDPTPFAMLDPGLHSPAQVQAAIERLQREPDALVLVNHFFAKRFDPFTAWVRSAYRDLGDVGPPGLRLYTRSPAR